MLSLASSSLSFAPAAGLKLAPRAAVSMEAGYYAVDAAGKRTGFWCAPPPPHKRACARAHVWSPASAWCARQRALMT